MSVVRKLLIGLILCVLITSTPAFAHSHGGSGGGVIPPTIPHPEQFDGFTINAKAKELGCNQNLPECGSEDTLWDAPYLTQVPYTMLTAGWVGGDREGYRCAYFFLIVGGSLLGRVTFVVPETPREITEGKYGIIKDDEMEEGVRFFGGALTPPGTIHTEPGECPDTNIPYESTPGPDVRPRIVYWKNQQVIEIRDYRGVGAVEGLVFNVHEVITAPFSITVPSGTYTVRKRITVVGYWNEAKVVVYYDLIGPGAMTVDFPT